VANHKEPLLNELLGEALGEICGTKVLGKSRELLCLPVVDRSFDVVLDLGNNGVVRMLRIQQVGNLGWNGFEQAGKDSWGPRLEVLNNRGSRRSENSIQSGGFALKTALDVGSNKSGKGRDFVVVCLPNNFADRVFDVFPISSGSALVQAKAIEDMGAQIGVELTTLTLDLVEVDLINDQSIPLGSRRLREDDGDGRGDQKNGEKEL